jgi:ribulose 1,5-bisphosphate synthetase/thiazole synthase
MQKVNGNKQTGMTFIGLVLVIAAVIFIAVIGIKVTPAYLEFFSVKKIISKIGHEANFNSMSKKQIVDEFTNGANISYVTVISGSDLVIQKSDEGNLVKAEYQVVLPVVANASILLDFSTSTAK